MAILFFDTETTSAENPRLIQLAYKKPGVEGEKYMFKPPVKIEFAAMAVHHITQEMVNDKLLFGTHPDRKDIEDIFSKHTVVAHNARFDIGVMHNEGIEIEDYIDTLRCAQHLLDSEAYNLQYLRYSLGLRFDQEINAHDAMSDVIVLEALYNHLHFKARAIEPIYTEDYLRELSKTPVLMKTIPFGKHKGVPFSQIPRDYLDWLSRQPELSEALRHTLNHHLK